MSGWDEVNCDDTALVGCRDSQCKIRSGCSSWQPQWVAGSGLVPGVGWRLTGGCRGYPTIRTTARATSLRLLTLHHWQGYRGSSKACSVYRPGRHNLGSSLLLPRFCIHTSHSLPARIKQLPHLLLLQHSLPTAHHPACPFFPPKRTPRQTSPTRSLSILLTPLPPITPSMMKTRAP